MNLFQHLISNNLIKCSNNLKFIIFTLNVTGGIHSELLVVYWLNKRNIYMFVYKMEA